MADKFEGLVSAHMLLAEAFAAVSRAHRDYANTLSQTEASGEVVLPLPAVPVAGSAEVPPPAATAPKAGRPKKAANGAAATSSAASAPPAASSSTSAKRPSDSPAQPRKRAKAKGSAPSAAEESAPAEQQPIPNTVAESASTESTKDAEPVAEEPAPSGKPRAKRAARDPNAPKAPAGRWIWFMKDHRSRVKQELSAQAGVDPSFGEVIEHLKQKWNTLSPAELQKYDELAKQDKERYYQETEDYRSSNPAAEEPEAIPEAVERAPSSAQAAPVETPAEISAEARAEVPSSLPPSQVSPSQAPSSQAMPPPSSAGDVHASPTKKHRSDKDRERDREKRREKKKKRASTLPSSQQQPPSTPPPPSSSPSKV